MSGDNEQGEVMNTPVPIIFTVFPRDDGSLNRRLVAALRIPSSFQIAPPNPTDSSIRIEDRPGMTVYILYVNTVKPCSQQEL
ncbi:heme-binding protein 1-like [Carassius auratus]|uniref:Heme-binding protein 1-like n=1 Tax=Carassius auratus TaxID=7957 RepID=A0A6P6MGS0_CARAU|nr:heme-binding protein 1-like [Carassius auratus]